MKIDRQQIEQIGESPFVTGLARIVVFVAAPLSSILGGWMLTQAYLQYGDIAQIKTAVLGIAETNKGQDRRIERLEDHLMSPTSANNTP